MKLTKFLLVCALTQLIGHRVEAQFRDAAIPATSFGISPIQPMNMGNDIMDVAGVSYSVTVWDDPGGPNNGFGWKSGTVQGYTPIGLGSQVMDPDIALVKSNSGVVYAVAVFYDNAQSRFMMESYQWNPNQQQYVSIGSIVLAPGTFHRSVNIGANDNGEFAIVWDEPGDLVRLSIGRAQTGPPAIVPIGTTSFIDLLPGSQPDVCVYRNASSNFRQVNVAYRHPAGYLEVDFYRWSDLLLGVVNAVPYYRSSMPDLAYNNPRIACPGSQGSNQNDFTLVTEDTDGNSTWYIKVMNSNMCCTPNFSAYIYNDGSGNSPYNTSDVPNNKPVVSYDNAYNMVWVGWEIDNSFGLLTAPGAAFGKFPVVITGNKRARLETLSRYLYVPTGVSFGSNSGLLSLAGSRSTTALFSYADGSNQQTYYKNYQHTLNASQLRSGSVNLWEWMETLNHGNDVTVEIFDLTGKSVTSFNTNSNELSIASFKRDHQLVSGLYILRVIEKSNGQSFNGPLFISE